MSKIEVDAIEPQSGTSLTLGASGDTITIPSGATITNSGTATGFGKVLQVVTATDSTTRTTTSTSYVTASNTLSITITPSSASNKILVIASTTARVNQQSFLTLFRGATNIGSSSEGMIELYFATSTGSLTDSRCGVTMSILDSPNTTSATTYQVYIKTTSGNTIWINHNDTKGSITAFEIEG
jgi:hypothetical protein